MPNAPPTEADAERYRRAKAIAFALLDRDARERDAALAAACGGDAALADEVRWLVAASEDASADALPPLGDLARLAAPLPRDYRVIRRIGDGGMGVVYLAERIDGDLRQRVALKLLRASAPDDADAHRRFASERRILSALAHPNIARLVDGGVTEHGLPFLAMEYVEGEPIDVWCARHAPSLRARIALVVKVCAAVDYAHGQLVIHRDIKPSNVLVGADGEPKLLDFGIARLVDGDANAARTRTDRRLLTPAYASPEQIDGARLTRASDVWSLGVVLYELVAGVRPFAHLETTHLLPGAIVSGEVPPPSRRAKTARVPRRVPADVDAIVMKALRREPAQRYASAAELANDLRRFLAARPVRARRGHVAYRVQRLVARRRWWFAAALALGAGIGAVVVDRVAQHERVALERDRAQAVVGFLDELFENTDALHRRGDDVTVRQMLDLGAANLAANAGVAPAQRAPLQFAIGRAYNALGRHDDAAPLLERAREALAATGAPPAQIAPVELALAAAYSGSRRLGDAVAADERALAQLARMPAPVADDVDQARIRVLHNRAVLLSRPLAQVRTELDAIDASLAARRAPAALKIAALRARTMACGADAACALAAAERALSLARGAYAADDPRVLPVRYAYVSALQEGEPEHAAELLPALVADYERRYGDSAIVASLLANHAGTLVRIGRAREAAGLFERAVAMTRATSGEDSDLYRWAVANRASAVLALGDPALAIALVESVLPGLVESAQAGGSSEAQVFAASARDTLADAALARGDAARAERELAAAAQGFAQVDADAYPAMHAQALAKLADVEIRRGRIDAARASLARLDAALAGRGGAAFDAVRGQAQALRARVVEARGQPAKP